MRRPVSTVAVTQGQMRRERKERLQTGCCAGFPGYLRPHLLFCIPGGPGTSPLSPLVHICWGEICKTGSRTPCHCTPLNLCSLPQQEGSRPILQELMALERGLQGPRTLLTLQNVLTWSQVSPLSALIFRVINCKPVVLMRNGVLESENRLKAFAN